MTDTVHSCSVEEAQEDMRIRCNDLWSELQKLQQQLDHVRQDSNADGDQCLSAVLQERQKNLQAEIDILNDNLKDTDPVLPPNPVLLHQLVEEELNSDVLQLEQLLSLLRANCEQIQQDIEQQKSMRDTLKRLQTSVEEKISAEESTASHSSQKEALSKLLERNARLEKLHATRVRQMISFVQEHYPAPTKEQVKDWHKKYGLAGSRMPSASSLKSLQTILELLMNKCIETPNDAYVELDDTFWPPYIEMLIRCGIVQRHPENELRIKLTAYHL